MNLQPTTYKVIYENKNITTDISDYLISLTYKDKHASESDEIELELHDKDLLWQNDWYPNKKSKIQVQIIDGESILDCGSFTIDENEYKMSRSSGETFMIRGLAAGTSKKLRTKSSSAHENKTLKELCNTIAAKHGLTVQGTIADIRINRITQYRETDLAFLNRISEKYGYTFSVRDSLLIFTSLFELVTKNHVLSLDKTECSGFNFKDGSMNAAKQSTVSYHNPSKNKLVSSTIERIEIQKELGNGEVSASEGDVSSDETPDFDPSDDEFVFSSVDDQDQAELVAKSSMLKSVTREQLCEIECPGNLLLIVGNQVELTGYGRFSGIYYIVESDHKLDRGGSYKTNFKANKTGKIPGNKHQPKKKKKSTEDYLTVEGPDYAEGSPISTQE